MAASAETTSTRPERALTILFWAAMAVAIIARVAFLADKPFWRDEAWVALLVGDPMRAAADGRAAPLGFLLIARMTSALPWPPEVTFRLFPLASGLVLLPVLWKLTLALGGSRRAAVAATWLAAGLQPFIYYSRELKSYEVDLLLAALVPLVGVLGFGAGSATLSMRAAFLVCVVVAPWVSFAGIFPVCAVFAWGWLAWWRAGDRSMRLWWLLCTVAFVASFAAVYVVALGNQSSDSWMQRYWHFHLSSDNRFWLPRKMLGAMWDYVSISTRYVFRGVWPVAVLLAAVGAWAWPRPQRRFLAFMYFGTAAFCAAAAAVDRYLIINGRHLLVAAPIAVLWVANGLRVLGDRFGVRRGAAVTLGIPVVLALGWSAQAIEHRVGRYHTNGASFFRLDVFEDVDAAIAAVDRLMRRGEPVLVSRKCAYAFQFYRGDRLPDATFCERHCSDFQRRAAKWLTRLDGPAWAIVSQEERRMMAGLVKDAGLGFRERASLRGVRVWKIESRTRNRSQRGSRWKSAPSKPPTTTWPQ